MKRDYPDRPLVGVGAVIVRDGRAVIVERSSEPLKGQWSIPGGALEIGETLRQCAAREALEETGLRVEAVDVLEVFDSIYPDPDGRTRYHYVLIDFFCRILDGELRAGGDAAQACWVSREELDSFAITETAQKVIRKALERFTD
jgi:8-oxo-dGTP diphosphatase